MDLWFCAFVYYLPPFPLKDVYNKQEELPSTNTFLSLKGSLASQDERRCLMALFHPSLSPTCCLQTVL